MLVFFSSSYCSLSLLPYKPISPGSTFNSSFPHSFLLSCLPFVRISYDLAWPQTPHVTLTALELQTLSPPLPKVYKCVIPHSVFMFSLRIHFTINIWHPRENTRHLLNCALFCSPHNLRLIFLHISYSFVAK